MFHNFIILLKLIGAGTCMELILDRVTLRLTLFLKDFIRI